VAKTLASVVIGTPYYLSPEQALGGTADERYRSAAEALEAFMGILDVRGEVPRDRVKGDSPRTIPAFARNNLQLID